MFWTKRVVIGDGERGLVYRNRQFERVLFPGVYRMFDTLKRVDVRTFNIAASEYAGHDVDALIARLGERLGDTTWWTSSTPCARWCASRVEPWPWKATKPAARRVSFCPMPQDSAVQRVAHALRPYTQGFVTKDMRTR